MLTRTGQVSTRFLLLASEQGRWELIAITHRCFSLDKDIVTLPELLGPASSSFPPNILGSVCPLRLEESGACILR